MRMKSASTGAVWVGIALASLPAVAAPKIINRIICRVNNEIITQRQFEGEQQKLRDDLSQHYSGAELDAHVRQQSSDLLRSMIDEDLLVQKAKDLDISVETDVIKQLDQVREANHLNSLQDLEKEVEKQGLVWEDFQDRIRRQLLVQQVIEREVGSRISITRDVARKYFDTHRDEFESPPGKRLGEILISNDKRTPEEAAKRAQDALAELKGGAKWEETVKKYSDDASNGPQGDIGFVKEGTMAPAVADAVAKLDVNDQSELVQVKTGYLILRVLEVRTGGAPKFEEVEQHVNETLYNQQMQGALRKYLGELRLQSYIQMAPGYIDTGAVKGETVSPVDLDE
ncbi:MAG TPA: peptidyl-prolyl cis-trans isomerase [Terriglobia bacterium]|jgi:peptidyl-prolyl cis-trans isomerase SurA|nr:peptidyl-prolyl cis-trans isomerase [Terriglobia bacterium]